MKISTQNILRIFLLLFLSTLPFFSSLLYFLPTDPPPYFMYLMALTKIFLLIAPFLFWTTLKIPGSWRNFPKILMAENISRKWNSWAFKKQIVLGVVSGILMAAVVLVSFACLAPHTRTEALRRIALKISVLHIKEHFWLYGIVLSVVHSCLEEFYWRFFILNAWKKRLPLIFAHIVAGLAFTLHHFTVTVHYFDFVFGMFLGLGVWGAGIIWSTLYEREGSLLASWISHIIVDLALISIGFRALNTFAY